MVMMTETTGRALLRAIERLDTTLNSHALTMADVQVALKGVAVELYHSPHSLQLIIPDDFQKFLKQSAKKN